MKNIYDSTVKDWQKVLKQIDTNNDQDFETFKDVVLDCFNNVENKFLNNLCEFIIDELGAYSDAELIDLTNEDIEYIIDYLNK